MTALEYAQKANEVFVLSDSFVRIKELIDDETSTIDDIAEVIMIDPALASTILKLANSSFFNYPGKIDTISKAVLVLGITEVYNLVIAYFTSDAFKAIDADAAYLERYWEASVDAALLIKYLGEVCKVPNAERMFILGLLHNLGELVVKQFDSNKLDDCVALSETEKPWVAQQSILGFTFADCTAELLKQWKLPFSLVEPIRGQDSDNILSQPPEAKMLYLAKRVMLQNSFYNKTLIKDWISDAELQELGLDNDILKAAISYCDMERLSVLSILKPTAMIIY